MTILKHDPSALLGVLLEDGLRWSLLSLAHADIDQTLVVNTDAPLSAEVFHERGRIDSSKEYEENRSLVVGLIVGGLHVERFLRHVLFSHGIADEGSQTRWESIGPQGSEQYQLLECRQILLVRSRELGVLNVFHVDPGGPFVAVTLHRISKTGKTIQPFEGLDLGPNALGQPLLQRSHVARICDGLVLDQVLRFLRVQLVVVHQYLQGEGRQNRELIALEQSPTDVVEQSQSDAVLEAFTARLDLLVFFLRMFLPMLLLVVVAAVGQGVGIATDQINCSEEDLLECSQAENVICVNFGQIIHQEEEQGASVGHGPVSLTRTEDVRLSLFGEGALVLNIVANTLRLLQALDELNVLGNVALGAG